MQRPHPVLPSQRYSPSYDYAHEIHARAQVLASSRQPLGESSGNVQPHSLVTSDDAVCYSQLSLPPTPVHDITTCPIPPTQTLSSSTLGTCMRPERSGFQYGSLQESRSGHALSTWVSGSQNPIRHNKPFNDYRYKINHQTDKGDADKTVWPEWLEEAFVDALLLMPQLGRKKYNGVKGLYGRNMLITEYLWIWHWTRNPPAEGENIPTKGERNGHEWFRTRKQVSSHIQVLKGFFPGLPTFHFIFPREGEGFEDETMKEDGLTASFKENQVLKAITEGRLPDERPNYNYWDKLFKASDDVFVKPKTCWLYVLSSKVHLEESHVPGKDGKLRKQFIGYPEMGPCITEEEYPHLPLNDTPEYKALLRRQGDKPPEVVLHEYTKNMLQKESSSIKEIGHKWDAWFPELRDKLTVALADSRPGDESTSRCVVGPCDMFHFEVVLDLHATSNFPGNADLNGLVELTITRPDLHKHAWRSLTSVSKPPELYYSDEPFEEQKSKIETAEWHPSNRDGSRSLTIPFPATSWANTFFKLAPYVTAERERKECERAARDAASLTGRAEREAARIKKENQETALHYKPKERTPKDLLSKTAMYQEIWSAPSEEVDAANAIQKQEAMGIRRGGQPSSDSGIKRPRVNWVRRAVILWTFVPVHENVDEKGKTTVVPAGCSWRFLTKLDPTCSYHAQNAYMSDSPAGSRDNAMSPNLHFAHHADATMHEKFSATYNASAMAAHTLASNGPSPSPLQLLQAQQNLGTFHNGLDESSYGLATPPPTATATLSSNYAHSLDGNTTNINPEHTLHHQLSFMSDGTNGTNATDNQMLTSTSSGPDPSDPFLTCVDVADYMTDFHATSSHDLGELTSRYADTTRQHAGGSESGDWIDTGPLSASSYSSDAQYSLLAAAAAAADQYLEAPDHQTHHHQQLDVHDDIDEQQQVQLQQQQQSAWTPWNHQHHQATEMMRLPSNLTSHSAENSLSDFSGFKADPDSVSYDGHRRASTGMWDGSDGGASIYDPSSYTLGSTGLTPLRPLLSTPQEHGLPSLMPLTLPFQREIHTPSPSVVAGHKRSREDLGFDAQDQQEEYELQSLRRLVHYPSVSSGGMYDDEAPHGLYGDESSRGDIYGDENDVNTGIADGDARSVASGGGGGGGAPTAVMGDESMTLL